MTILTPRKAALPFTALAAAGVLLAACSSSDDGQPLAPRLSPMSSTSTVSDEDLGVALDRLVFQGGQHTSLDGGACLVTAAKKAGLSENAQAYIVETRADDRGAATEGVRQINTADAEVLLSPQMRKDFDTCVDVSLSSKAGKGNQAYEPPKPAGKPTEKNADLRPKYEIKESTSITSAAQLTKGLVSMFSSYALDEKQKGIYAAAGECLSGVVFAATYSQETLRFLAGGAPISTGSVADHLPTDEDKKTWRSQGFSTALVDCTTTAKP